MSTEKRLEALAVCLDYPRDGTGTVAKAAASEDPLGQAFVAMAEFISDSTFGASQERYTVLFDLKPVCTLNIGYHIFGDTYDRGALLALLAAELGTHNIEHSHDLPDYLPTLLRLLAASRDAEDQALLVHSILIPGLSKMNQTLSKSTDPWSSLLRALPNWLAATFPAGEFDLPAPPSKLLEVV